MSKNDEDLEPLACPKCHMYKVESDDNSVLLDLFLLVITCGLWVIVMIFRNHTKTVKEGDKLICRNCNYRWVYRE
jgi:DNA-directed RNA polymerase subunit RPC12/RpoP